MLSWLRRMFADTPAPVSSPVAVAAPEAPRQRSFAADTVSARQRHQIDFIYASWLFEAESHPDIFTNRTEDAILTALDAVVKSEQSGAHLVRRMPGVIPQLLQSLRSDDFSNVELAHKISHDVVLVAEVLRLANSVAYSPGTSITSVENALLVLGEKGLRQLITSVAFRPIINLNSGDFTKRLAPRLWALSERCAFASHMLARDTKVDPLDAFLAGLVQNIGLTVSLRVIDQLSDGRQPVGSPTFCNALATYGRTLAFNIGREWNFPESVTAAIREQETRDTAAGMSAVGRILFMGDYLSKIDTLARHARVSTDDADVIDGLSEKELACLQQLATVEERDWLSVVTPAGR